MRAARASRSRSAGAYAPGRRGVLSLLGPDVHASPPRSPGRADRRRHALRARTGRSTPSCSPPPPSAARDEAYATGGAQAIAAMALGTEIDRAGRRDRRPGQPLRAGGQAPARRPRRHRRRSPGPSELMVVFDGERRAALARARPLRPGRARGRRAARRGRAPTPTRSPSSRAWSPSSRPSATASPRPRSPSSQRPSTEAAVELANELAPEHLQLACDAATLIGRGHHRGLRLRRRRQRDRLRRLRRRLQPRAADGRRGALHRAARPVHLQAPHGDRSDARTTPPGSSLRPVATLARIEGFPVHGESVEARRDDPETGNASS